MALGPASHIRYTSSVEILDLRHFASPDLRPLIDEEVALWRSSLHWDYRASAEMVLRYADTRILPGFAAIERGRLRGYCYFVYEGDKGVIGDLFVESANFTADRRHQIECELLRHAISTLQRSPGLTRIEAQLLIHPTDHLAAPFLREGFRRYRRLFLSLPIANALPQPTRPLPPEIELHSWTEDDYQPAAAIITAAYAGHVDSDVNDQYRTIAGSLRFLNNIVRFPGCGVFDPVLLLRRRPPSHANPHRRPALLPHPPRRRPCHPGLHPAPNSTATASASICCAAAMTISPPAASPNSPSPSPKRTSAPSPSISAPATASSTPSTASSGKTNLSSAQKERTDRWPTSACLWRMWERSNDHTQALDLVLSLPAPLPRCPRQQSRLAHRV